MTTAKSLIAICETNPVLSLLQQRNRHYPLEVAHRLFRDDYAVEAPIEDFLRTCGAVRDELQLRDGGGHYLTPPDKMLEAWCDAARGHEPWFALTDDHRGRMVALRPAARTALEMAIDVDEDADQTSGETTRAYFKDITGAAAHLRRDAGSTIAKLTSEIEERQRRIAEIEEKGLRPATDDERQRYAIELTGFISNLLTTLGKVPTRLRENLRDARETYNTLDGSHGAIMRTILESLSEERRRPGYRTLEALNAIHNDPRERAHVEAALEVIVTECADHLSARTQREARSLFRSLSDISLRILSEDHDAACQMANLVESETFERRLGQARLLMELSETMRAHAHLMPLRLRGPTDTPGFALGAAREDGVKIHWFDLRLAEAPPAPVAPTTRAHPPVTMDRDSARAAVEEASAKSAYLDTQRLATWIEKIVAKNGPTALSKIIAHRPLRFGLDEIAAFTNVAMTRVPATFTPGWEMAIVLAPTDGEDDMPCPPGTNLLVRCPDPVFLPDGQPGQGVGALGERPRDRADLGGIVAEVRANARATTQAAAVDVIRPAAAA